MNSYQNLQQWLQQHSPVVKTQYQVPELGEGGACSLFGELSDEPFDLNSALKQSELPLVKVAQSIVDWVEKNTDVDWFGIYLKRQTQQQETVLTKLAYFGEPSRAEFPLTPEFAQISNNTNVGLSGQGRLINNVAEYVKNGGEYYTCDPKVKSELCWPLIQPNTDNQVIGIIDAECFSSDYFNDEQQAIFDAVCRITSEQFAQIIQ